MTPSPPYPPRRPTPTVRVGNVCVGGDHPVSVQTMTKCSTADAGAVLAEIRATVGIDVARDLDARSRELLERAGLYQQACERGSISTDLTRVSVPDEDSAAALPAILAETPVPVVADIHFKQRMALLAIEAGVHKIRINPGNIRDPKLIVEIAAGCRERGIPIRVGVNAGSLPRDIRDKYPDDTVTGLVESAVRSVGLLEDVGFTDMIVSLKANRADVMMQAYRTMAERCVYPLHLGVTEAGVGTAAVVNSFAGIGGLLLDGIGDTIRVSLTENAALEVVVGRLLVDAIERRRAAAAA